MAFRAAVVVLLMSSVSSKYLHLNISFIIRNRKKLFGLDLVNREGFPAQLFVYYLKSLSLLALIQAPIFLRWHTRRRWDNNTSRSHSERDCCTSTTTAVKCWYAIVIKPCWGFCPLLWQQAHWRVHELYCQTLYAGKGQQQFTGPNWTRLVTGSECLWRWGPVSEWVNECALESPPVEGVWPVVFRPPLSLKKSSHFKTCRSLEQENVVMGPSMTWNQEILCWQWQAAI
jgi:hypothetical protein